MDESVRQGGVTAIEMMIALAVAAILLTLAAPSFTNSIRDNRLITQANDFLTALNLARSEALKRATFVTLASNNGTANFGGGWTILVDPNRNGLLDVGEVTVRTADALASGMTLSSSDNVAAITFNSRGALDPGSNRTFLLCDDRTGETGRRMVINPAGRPRVEKATEDPKCS